MVSMFSLESAANRTYSNNIAVHIWVSTNNSRQAMESTSAVKMWTKNAVLRMENSCIHNFWWEKRKRNMKDIVVLRRVRDAVKPLLPQCSFSSLRRGNSVVNRWTLQNRRMIITNTVLINVLWMPTKTKKILFILSVVRWNLINVLLMNPVLIWRKRWITTVET